MHALSRRWLEKSSILPEQHQRYWLIGSLVNLSVALPMSVMTAFLLEAGWDYVGIGVVASIILGTSALCGGPAGLMADRLGRRHVVTFGAVSLCLAYAGWAFDPGLGPLWAIFQGIGSSATSSPLQAWAVDGLPAQGKHTPSTLLARGQTYAKLAALAGSIVILAARIQDYRAVYLIAAVVAAVVTSLSLGLMRETQRRVQTSTRGKRPPLSPQLIAATAYMIFLFLSFSFYMFLWQPGLLSRGLGPHQLPACNGVFSLAAAASAHGLGLVRSRSGFTLMSCILPGTAALGLLVSTGHSALMVSLAGYLLFNAAYFGAMVVGHILLNRAAESAWRATTLGSSMSVALAINALTQPALGALVAGQGPVVAGRFAALLCVPLIPLALLAKGKDDS